MDTFYKNSNISQSQSILTNHWDSKYKSNQVKDNGYES